MGSLIKPTARAKSVEIRKLASEGLGKVEIAQRLGINERSVYRVLAASSPAQVGQVSPR